MGLIGGLGWPDTREHVRQSMRIINNLMSVTPNKVFPKFIMLSLTLHLIVLGITLLLSCPPFGDPRLEIRNPAFLIPLIIGGQFIRRHRPCKLLLLMVTLNI